MFGDVLFTEPDVYDRCTWWMYHQCPRLLSTTHGYTLLLIDCPIITVSSTFSIIQDIVVIKKFSINFKCF